MTINTKQKLAETRYARAECTAGIVHVGYGAFHRAHQAVYIDDYMDKTGDLRWGVTAVNLRAEEAISFAANDGSQDGYILKSVDSDGTSHYRKVRCHLGFVDWSSSARSAEALLSDPNIHMVTITVTESGYYLDIDGSLNVDDPIIAQEIQGKSARSVYAYLAAALRQRSQTINQPITILCCDNIRRNGKMLAANMASYLKATDQPELAEWTRENVTFPCSMVDRITPRTTSALTGEIQSLFGTNIAPPVMSEGFIQWVLQNDFAGPMPDLAKANVTVVDDVDPYEEAKIRILNGGHTCLTYLAALRGFATFDQAMHDADLLDHFMQYELQEVLPALTIDLPFDKSEYLEEIKDRFSNAAIADTVERICADGFAKFPIFIRPTIDGCLKQGKMPHYAIHSIASWYVFSRLHQAGDLKIAYAEPNWENLEPLLADGQQTAFVHSKTLWADLPETYPDFPTALLAEIEKLETTWLK